MQLNIDVSTFKIHLLAVMLYFAWYLLFHNIQLPLVLSTQLSFLPCCPIALEPGDGNCDLSRQTSLYFTSATQQTRPKIAQLYAMCSMKHRLREEGNFTAQQNVDSTVHTGKALSAHSGHRLPWTQPNSAFANKEQEVPNATLWQSRESLFKKYLESVGSTFKLETLGCITAGVSTCLHHTSLRPSFEWQLDKEGML